MTAPPVLLLDVDGVLNASKAGWSRAPHAVNVWSQQDRQKYRIRWEPRCLAELRHLHDSGLVEIVWSTTWCPDIRGLEDALHAGPWPRAFTERPAHLTWADLKVRAALGHLADERRIVWVDDVEVGAGRAMYPEIAEAEENGQALLIAPNPGRGLRPEHITQIETFCKET